VERACYATNARWEYANDNAGLTVVKMNVSTSVAKALTSGRNTPYHKIGAAF
jgi:hypothetical protein